MIKERPPRSTVGLYWILRGKKLVEADRDTWARWFESNERIVKSDHFGHAAIGVVHVSTVCLGLDHNWSGKGPPIVFETMIFGGAHDEYQDRCATYDEALVMHEKAVQLAVSQFKELIRDVPGA